MVDMPKIYVASSWRNPYYEQVVKRLREQDFEVYDFRNPPHGGKGFHWTDVDENAPNWTFEEYAEGLKHPLAEKQFQADLEALEWADACVLVLPCGRSAHTEAGWMAGRGKKVVVYIPKMEEPELMYKLFDAVVSNTYDLIRFFEPNKVPRKMTKEELDILWEVSGREQEKMMAEVNPSGDDSIMDSPMFQRWLDGSDIVGNDDDDMPWEEFEKTLEGLPEDDANVLRVHRCLELEWPRKEALAKYGVSNEYYKANIKRLLKR